VQERERWWGGVGDKGVQGAESDEGGYEGEESGEGEEEGNKEEGRGVARGRNKVEEGEKGDESEKGGEGAKGVEGRSSITDSVFSENKSPVPLPKRSWSSNSDLRNFLEFLAEKLHVFEEEDWYRVSTTQVSEFGGTSSPLLPSSPPPSSHLLLLGPSPSLSSPSVSFPLPPFLFLDSELGFRMLIKYGNLFGALKQAYPNTNWDESKFSNRGKKSNQRSPYFSPFPSLHLPLPPLPSLPFPSSSPPPPSTNFHSSRWLWKSVQKLMPNENKSNF
jgi:hypothetical protein